MPIDVGPDYEIEERLKRLKKRPVKKDARVALADDNIKTSLTGKICVDAIDKKESVKN